MCQLTVCTYVCVCISSNIHCCPIYPREEQRATNLKSNLESENKSYLYIIIIYMSSHSPLSHKNK